MGIPLGHLEDPGRDRRQRLLQRGLLELGGQEDAGLPDAFLDDGLLDRPLVGEMLVDQGFAHARRSGKVAAPGPPES